MMDSASELLDYLWSSGLEERLIQTPSPCMWTPNLTSGLFDINALNPEPPDILDLDPDRLSTMSMKRNDRHSADSTSSHSTSNLSEIETMLSNWQMNEVYQEIPSPIDDDLSTFDASAIPALDDDLDLLMKHVFPESEPDQLVEAKTTSVVTSDGAEVTASLDLQSVVQETFGSDATLDGFSLLEELEAMEQCRMSCHTEAEELTASTTLATVEADHQYTRLSNVQAKPNETKKQAIRRVKNNAASKVCRKQRKNRFALNAAKVEELRMKNQELMNTISQVQSVVDMLKEHLVSATTAKV